MKRSLLVLVLAFLASLPTAAQLGATPWFLGLDGGVYQVSDGRPKRLGLASGCSSLAVAAGVPWVIGGDGRVWTTGGDGDRWAPLPEGIQGRQIAAGSDGAVFLLGLDGGVYRRKSPGQWRRVGLGSGQDLAVGAGSDLFLVGTDRRVWVSRNADGTWLPFNDLARGVRVAAGSDGAVYLLGMDSGIYRVGERDVARLGLATATDLAVSPSGEVYAVGTDQGVWSFDGRTWNRVGSGTAKAVTFNR